MSEKSGLAQWLPRTPIKLTSKNYVAIRKNEVHEWIDISTLDLSYELTKCKVHKWDLELPQWAKANPVIRIVEVEISEVKNG